MKEIAGKIDNKNVRFSDAQIGELFEFLNTKTRYEYNIVPITNQSRWWINGTYVNKIVHLNELKQHGKIISTDVNAYLTFSAGDSYDKQSSEQRTKMCQKKAAEALTAINSALASSEDPLFSILHAEIKNREIDYCYEKKDQSDDGYDLFCCELWLKISYVK